MMPFWTMLFASLVIQAPTLPPRMAEGCCANDAHMHLLSLRLAQTERNVFGADAALEATPRSGEDVIRSLDSAGVASAAVVSAAYAIPLLGLPDSVSYDLTMHENDFVAMAVRERPDRLYGFAGVDARAPWAPEEIRRAHQKGLAGVKLSFPCSAVRLDRRRDLLAVRMVFRTAAVLGMPVLLHFESPDDPNPAVAARLLVDSVLAVTPGVIVQIAHLGGFGGYTETTDTVLAVLLHADSTLREQMYFDLAWVFEPGMPVDRRAIDRIRRIEAGHVLIGSDWPIFSAGEATTAIRGSLMQAASGAELWDAVRRARLPLCAQTRPPVCCRDQRSPGSSATRPDLPTMSRCRILFRLASATLLVASSATISLAQTRAGTVELTGFRRYTSYMSDLLLQPGFAPGAGIGVHLGNGVLMTVDGARAELSDSAGRPVGRTSTLHVRLVYEMALSAARLAVGTGYVRNTQSSTGKADNGLATVAALKVPFLPSLGLFAEVTHDWLPDAYVRAIDLRDAAASTGRFADANLGVAAGAFLRLGGRSHQVSAPVVAPRKPGIPAPVAQARGSESTARPGKAASQPSPATAAPKPVPATLPRRDSIAQPKGKELAGTAISRPPASAPAAGTSKAEPAAMVLKISRIAAYFVGNSAVLSMASQPPLIRLARDLAEDPDALVEISGSVTVAGDTGYYAMRLSEMRADAIARFLVQYGVRSSQIRIRTASGTHVFDPSADLHAWPRPTHAAAPSVIVVPPVAGSRATQPAPIIIYFAFNSAELNNIGRGALLRLAHELARDREAAVEITGHTDERGDSHYNVRLGRLRANAVARYLVMHGVRPAQMLIYSKGGTRPSNPAHNRAAWRKNRRVEIRTGD